ncbi:MAG: GAF domain-containing protein [Anaerolineae bacterium]|nr:GAF domain-containing protein [Anaerolineae bacterium]
MKDSIQSLEEERHSFHTLVSTGRIINSTLDPDEVLLVAMDQIIQLTSAERGFLMLRDSSGGLQIEVARNWEQETLDNEEVRISKTVIDRVINTGEPVITTNAQEDPRFLGQDSIVAYSLRSILCVPLTLKQEKIGVVYVDSRLRSGLFTNTDLNALQAFANQTAVAIENARLFVSLRHTLAEVTELKNLMDGVFHSMASGLIMINQANQVVLCNPAAGDILRTNADLLVGAPIHAVCPGFAQGISGHIQTVLTSEMALTGLEISGNLAGNERQDLRLSIAPLKDSEGTVQGAAVVFEDETEQRRLKAQRRLFERMVSPAVISQLNPDRLQLAGRRGVITTLFADIRGFTSFSETVSPEIVFSLLNQHWDYAVEAILREGGTIDKYLGDAVMAWFNAPVPLQDHPYHAVRAALAIQMRVARLHQTLSPENHFHFGIGLHMGEAVLGLVGTEQRMEYTAIGDSVNTAKRVQEYAAPGQVLITDQVYDVVHDRVAANHVASIKVKGKRNEIQVYEVKGLRSQHSPHT